MKLTNDQIERFRGQINLKKINIQGQIKLKRLKILIIGAGGIGSPVALYLARAGIYEFGIIDYDKINKSNLHRQVLFNQVDIGQKKVFITKKKIQMIDKKIKVKAYAIKVNKQNLKEIIANYDYIIDGTDNFKSKLNINDECLRQKKKLFIGSVSQFDAHIFFFDFSKKGPCLRCFMPRPPQNVPRCQDDGIIGTVTGMAGIIICNELIKNSVGINSNLKNETLIINLEDLLFRKVKIKISKICKNHE
tara:strand:+ start:3897 stop:4640 length:744 start_codon:yes stop_codon:yes gene_type:complete